MLGLVNLNVYNSIFSITEENNNFELYKYPDGKSVSVSYEKGRDDIEKDLDVSDFTDTDLQDDIVGSIFIDEFRNQVTKILKDGKYIRILALFLILYFKISKVLSE